MRAYIGQGLRFEMLECTRSRFDFVLALGCLIILLLLAAENG